jgi:hypothetical protein
MSILSKLIYEYDYVNENNNKKNYYIVPNINLSPNLTYSDIIKQNIYFIPDNNKKDKSAPNHFATFLHKKDFYPKTNEYFTILHKIYPETQIYGYFYKKRLHSLILINHRFKEIIVVFRGSQYMDEWLNNIFINETTSWSLKL